VRTKVALSPDEHVAHAWQARHGCRDLVDLGRPDRARHVVPVDGDYPSLDDDICALRQRRNRRFIVQGDVLVERLPTHRAIHGAGIDMPVAERL